jgi:hypothetical protein
MPKSHHQHMSLKKENQIEVCERLSVTGRVPISRELVGRIRAGEVTEKKRAPGQQYDPPPPPNANTLLYSRSWTSSALVGAVNDDDGSDDSDDENRRHNRRSHAGGLVLRGRKRDDYLVSDADVRRSDIKRDDERQIAVLEQELQWAAFQEKEQDALQGRFEQEAFLIQKFSQRLDCPQYIVALESLCREIEREDQARRGLFLQGPGEIVLGFGASYKLVQQPKPTLNGLGVHWGDVYRKWKSGRLDSTWKRNLLGVGWQRNEMNGYYWRYRRGTSDGDQRYVFKVRMDGKVVGIWDYSDKSHLDSEADSTTAVSQILTPVGSESAMDGDDGDEHDLVFGNPWL